jgi:hypothetical protein
MDSVATFIAVDKELSETPERGFIGAETTGTALTTSCIFEEAVWFGD